MALAACCTMGLLSLAYASAASVFGRRAGVAALAAGVLSLGIVRPSRLHRWQTAIHQRLARESYDERRILADLSYAGRAVVTRAELFELVASKIGEALGPASVAIFVREDETGGYACELLSRVPCGVEAAGDETPSGVLRLPPDAFVTRRLGRLSTPLHVGAGDYESWARALSSANEAKRAARRHERETLERVGAALLLPVMMKDELVGVLSLGARRGGQPYTEADKRLLLSVAGQMAFIIENSKLAERIVEEERLRRELRMAEEVQRRLFPERAPACDGVDLAGSCRPARGIGGDYYDFLVLDERLTGLAVADVAGKGISAALLMSIVQASLRSQAASAKDGSLAELVSTMNQLMYGSTGAASFASFFYAQFDSRSGRLTYVNAGHNPPLLLRAAVGGGKVARPRGVSHEAARARGAWTTSAAAVEEEAATCETPAGPETLTTGGPVIGVISDCVYEQATVEMRSGDVLLAYTDGVTEALNTADEEFGEERLIRVLEDAAHLTAEELRAEVVRRVGEWCGTAPQHDDLTVVVLKVH